MTLRTPPGRAGRQWLVSRIATADHARGLLEQKRAVLLAAERAAGERAAAASAAWRSLALEAARWLERSALLDGERARRLAGAHAGPEAAVHVGWGVTMGVQVPSGATLELAPAADAALLPAGSALTAAIAAHRAAVEAALHAAVETAAHDRLAAELVATVRRVRAIESRWLPLHREALAALEQALDENDRAEGARIRWAAHAGRRVGEQGDAS